MWAGCGGGMSEAPSVQMPSSGSTVAGSPVHRGAVVSGSGAASLGMVRISGGVVQLGPRHLPPIDGASMPEGGMHIKPEPIAHSRPSRWTSVGGRGLMPRMVQIAPFMMDQTEVTRAAYSQFLTETGYRLPHVAEAWADDGWNWTDTAVDEILAKHPVVLVSFYDAEAYCRWRNKRLPSEAEWQMAALGPASDQRAFPWGSRYRDDWLNHGRMEAPNFDGSDGFSRTAPVGSFSQGRSPSGLDDMFGNVWEFTADLRIDDWGAARHDGFGSSGEMINARAPGPGLRVAVRGGSFYFDFRPNPGGEWASFVPEIRRKSAGFRCASAVSR
jgi:sulfatase modifying factor 1